MTLYIIINNLMNTANKATNICLKVLHRVTAVHHRN